MPFGGFHWFYLVVLLVVVLIIFGPGKLPELGAGLGRAMQEFRKASNEFKDEVSKATTSEPASNNAPPAVEAPKSQAEPKG
jgi:sec-independent protein translocase protein TatA